MIRIDGTPSTFVVCSLSWYEEKFLGGSLLQIFSRAELMISEGAIALSPQHHFLECLSHQQGPRVPIEMSPEVMNVDAGNSDGSM